MMNLKKKSNILFGIALFIAMFFSGVILTDEVDAKSNVVAPVRVTLDNKGAVSITQPVGIQPESYNIQLYKLVGSSEQKIGQLLNTKFSGYQLEDFIDELGATYRVGVMAVYQGQSSVEIPSNYMNFGVEAQQVTDLQIKNGKVTWTAPKNGADKYCVQLYKNNMAYGSPIYTSLTNCDYTQVMSSDLKASYNVSVRTLVNGQKTSSPVYSKSVMVSKVVFDKGLLTWISDTKTTYNVGMEVFGNGKWMTKVTFGFIEGNSFEFKNFMENGKTYRFFVEANPAFMCNGSDKVYTSSLAYQGEKELTSPSNLNWDGHVAQWSKVDNAFYYQVNLYEEGKKVRSFNTVGTTFNLATIGVSEGKYSFNVTAMSKENSGYKDSKVSLLSSNHDFVTELTRPLWYRSKVGKYSVRINWKKVPTATLYGVYRKDGIKGKYKRIAWVKGTSKVKLSYLNRKLGVGRYYYAVRAYKKYDGKYMRSPWSKIKRIIMTGR